MNTDDVNGATKIKTILNLNTVNESVIYIYVYIPNAYSVTLRAAMVLNHVSNGKTMSIFHGWCIFHSVSRKTPHSSPRDKNKITQPFPLTRDENRPIGSNFIVSGSSLQCVWADDESQSGLLYA